MRRRHRSLFRTGIDDLADPRIVTVADTAHSEWEERWSIALASNGARFAVGYLYLLMTRCRRTLISAKAEQKGMSQLLTGVLKRDIEIGESLK
jgi:hypothetical protein